MQRIAFVLAAATALGIAATATAQTPPRDTGNMAYPAPLPQGNVVTTGPGATRAPTDTGNMAYPTPLPQGNVATSGPGASRAPTDTGNMAYPTPLPQGQVGSTTAK